MTHKQFCPLCNQEITIEELNTAYSVQAIIEEFKKMREAFEKDHDLNLSQVPIQYLSHQDTLEQDTPRSSCKVLYACIFSSSNNFIIVGIANCQGPLSDIRSLSSKEPRQIKVYVKNKIPVSHNSWSTFKNVSHSCCRKVIFLA